MTLRLRQISPKNKLADELAIELFSKIIPVHIIQYILKKEHIQQQRVRKLSHTFTVYLVIAMALYSTVSIAEVMKKVAFGLKLLFGPKEKIIGASGIHYRRDQIGARVMSELFHNCCNPIATEQTKGAFFHGFRLVSIDGSYHELPDTPRNEKAFGRHYTQKGEAAFPQVQAVYLIESGTRCIFDGGFWPVHTSERIGGYRMVRSIEKDMLVMWDRGFHSYKMCRLVVNKGAHFLGRVPKHCKFEKIKQLPDGSYLSHLKGEKGDEPIVVRVIEYRIKDTTRDPLCEVHRIITTLLDHTKYDITELICCYHERWEIEIAIDEIDTHLLNSRLTIRSKSPKLVMQELYGILLAHYITRSMIHDASIDAEIDPDRISFTDSIELLKNYILVSPLLEDTKQQNYLYLRFLADVAMSIIPPRRNRINPRVVKKASSKFERKKEKHKQIKQPELEFREVLEVCAYNST